MCSSVLFALALTLLLLIVSPGLVRSQCDGCVDATQTAGCPYPELCGFKTINCTNPITSPHPEWCINISCISCMGGMQMPGCPDPAACGFGLLPCIGCSLKANTTGCPKPQQCTACMNLKQCPMHESPPCLGCMDGMGMPDCPDPGACGYGPITTSCVDCMKGMSMPTCPRPESCPDSAFGSASGSCMMQSVFGTSSDLCVFLASWYVTSGGQWFALSLGIFLGALLREWLLVHRQHRARMKKRFNTSKKSSMSTGSTGSIGKLASPLLDSSSFSPLSPSRLTATPNNGEDAINCLIGAGYYLLTLVLAYLLMLLIMTYNLAVFVLVVLSSALANFICSYGMLWYWRRHTASTVQHNGDGNSPAHGNRADDMDVKMQQDPCCADLDLGDETL